MSNQGPGPVLMEPLYNNRRPGPPTGPPVAYTRPLPGGNAASGSTPHGLLPPVHPNQGGVNGVWRGPVPPPSQSMQTSPATLSQQHGSPRPGSSGNGSGMMQQRNSGLSNSPMPPAIMNFPHHGQRPMPPGANGRPPLNSSQPPPPQQQQQQQQGMGKVLRPPSGSSSPSMPPVPMTSNNTSVNSGPMNASRGVNNGGGMSGPRPPMHPSMPQQHPHPPQHPQQHPQQQVRRGPRVASVARGPQPTLIEATRLRDGRRIKDVQRQQQQQQQQGQGQGQGHAERGPHRFTGPSKNAAAAKNNDNPNNNTNANNNNNNNNNRHEPRPIKTTVGNDESWVKGLTYSTWVDSPRGNLTDLDVKDGPYKRQGGPPNNRRRKPEKKNSNSSSNSGGVMEMLRNLFR